jgi:uncharacterized membrane protein
LNLIKSTLYLDYKKRLKTHKIHSTEWNEFGVSEQETNEEPETKSLQPVQMEKRQLVTGFLALLGLVFVVIPAIILLICVAPFLLLLLPLILVVKILINALEDNPW